jgi:mRNA interferase MazF
MISGVSAPSATTGREKTTVARGDVLEVDLEPAEGSEMAKTRPCLVVSNNAANQSSPLITVVAITSQPPKKPYPFTVEVPNTANMPKKSWVNTAHIRTIDRQRLTGKYLTSLDRATMRKVDTALKKQLGIP